MTWHVRHVSIKSNHLLANWRLKEENHMGNWTPELHRGYLLDKKYPVGVVYSSAQARKCFNQILISSVMVKCENQLDFGNYELLCMLEHCGWKIYVLLHFGQASDVLHLHLLLQAGVIESKHPNPNDKTSCRTRLFGVWTVLQFALLSDSFDKAMFTV